MPDLAKDLPDICSALTLKLPRLDCEWLGRAAAHPAALAPQV